MSAAPVFLLSSERSGSNLIRVMFDSHPSFDAPHAPHLIKTFLPLLPNYGDLSEPERLGKLARDMITVIEVQLRGWPDLPSAEEVLEAAEHRTFAGLIRSLYGLVAKAHGKTRSFIKDNGNMPHAPEISVLFPDAKFIYLVRDPRDVALSWKKSPGHPGGVRDAAKMWRLEQTQALNFYSYAKDRGIVSIVHYEDMVADQAGAFAKAFETIGEAFDSSMLSFHEGREAKISADAAIGWTNLTKPVMGENTRKWERELSRGEIRTIERIAGAPMRALGYDPEIATDIATTEQDTLGKVWRAARGALTQIKRGRDGIDELKLRAKRLKGLRQIMLDASRSHPRWSRASRVDDEAGDA